jgi:hypothetical protein
MLFLSNRSLTLLMDSSVDFLFIEIPWKANFLTNAPTIIPDVTREAVLTILFMTMVVLKFPYIKL